MSHARLAPSSAGRWCHCPGSVTMEERYPDDGDEGSAGEASHWVGSELLSTGTVHRVGEVAPNGVVLDAEMIEGAWVYARAVMADLGDSRMRVPLHVERPVDIHRVHPGCFGTPDLRYFLPIGQCSPELHIWDYKFGWGLVDVIGNWQLTCYAAGALAEFNAPPDTLVVFHIVQPRPYHALGAHRQWRVSTEALQPAIEQLRTAAYEALGPDPQVRNGSHCRYCRARHDCPAARNAMYAAFEYVERAQPTSLNAEQLGAELAVLERAEEAIKYLKTGVTQQVLSMIDRGESVPGWVVERGQGRSTWNLPAEQIAIIGDLIGVNVRKPAEPKTPAQCKMAGMPVEVIREFSTQPVGDPKLVRSDKSLTAQVFGPAAAARQGA